MSAPTLTKPAGDELATPPVPPRTSPLNRTVRH